MLEFLIKWWPVILFTVLFIAGMVKLHIWMGPKPPGFK